MITIVEDFISEVLHSCLDKIRANPEEMLPTILKMSPTKLQDLSKYLKDNEIVVKRGYPRTQAELPCICIMLSGENEAQEGIGDYMEDIGGSVSVNREELVVQSDITRYGGAPFIQTSKFPIQSVSIATNVTLGIPCSDDIDYDSFGDRGIILVPSAEDGDIISAEYIFLENSVSGVYTQFENNFRIEVWTTNGDLTVQLYHLAKWALLVGRDKLHLDTGMYRQRLGGADFQPAPSFFPDFVYRRALTLWCQLTTTVPVEEVNYISEIEVNRTIEFDTQNGGEE